MPSRVWRSGVLSTTSRSGGASRFWCRGRGVVAVGVLVALSMLWPAQAGAQQPQPALEDISVRDELIAAQELLLNAYRCLFDFDTEVVPGGCADGKPVGEPVPLPDVEGGPTSIDIEVRDRVVAVQEALLNAYRCLFGVDMEVVPGGCPSQPVPVPFGGWDPATAQSPLPSAPLSFEQSLDVASRLATSLVPPSDCPVPVESPDLMPNAPRDSYRAGIHQGVDFACFGRTVRAVLDGRVVVAVGDYTTPPLPDLEAVLATTYELGATPPYILIMLYGNYVVIDHGMIDGVGHVASLYVHLDALDPDIKIGGAITAGQPLGVMGSTGTVQAAAGVTPLGYHLHWELHINGHYLAQGLSIAETEEVYRALFQLG